jgi:hypothetical protein
MGRHVAELSNNNKKKFSAWYWYVPVVVVVGSSLLFLYSRSRAPKQIEETVAIDSSRRAVIPTGTPVAITNELPMQERDVEAVGDRIAETILYLKKRQTAAALRSLRQAEVATNHALAVRAHNGAEDNELLTTLGELEAAERAIQRGGLDEATRQLIALERKLDGLAR